MNQFMRESLNFKVVVGNHLLTICVIHKIGGSLISFHSLLFRSKTTDHRRISLLVPNKMSFSSNGISFPWKSKAVIEAVGSRSTGVRVIKGKSYFWLALFIGVFGLAEPFYFFKSKEFFLIYMWVIDSALN